MTDQTRITEVSINTVFVSDGFERYICLFFKGALPPGLLLFLVNSAQITAFCLLSCKTMLLPNQQDKLQLNFSRES